ncbi:transglutaminase-like putative cysteine protease [Deinobacterium chartae]|uniref:Transglutaminase-like putative cysteine protease n=1 Tax=Deinobacterium chartae TaxID=521158 RepID=A0A841HZ19_9DEIO|nr:DUF3488 and transglutaminase-like domain-containing protein [Deinobacterium chartae]MBB6098116.1 transglutaminase-like putative cysteine protease [Deinobacterium chartae]
MRASSRSRPAAAGTLPVRPLQALIGALALAFLPYALHLPVWMTLLLGLLLASRVLLARRGLGNLPVPLLLLVAALSAWGLVGEYQTLAGRDGGTALLLILVTLKLHESRTRRDALLLVLLGYFVTAAYFFFSQELFVTVYLLTATLALTAVLAVWQGLARRPLRRAARLLAQAIPLALALFVLFPRPAGPLWTLPVTSPTAAQTGLADQVNPGSFSNLARSDAVAFRVSFEQNRPARQQLYWRGPVFERYSEPGGWRQGPLDLRTPLVQVSEPLVHYTLTLEPNGRPWLLALDAPALIPPRSRITAQFQVITRSSAERRRFDLASATQYQVGRREYRDRLEATLQLPPGGNPRTRALAAQWSALPPAQRVERGLDFLRRGGFAYTLSPPTLPETDPQDAFLFESKLGFCEHYASAFAYLMRAAGVPARVVGGYQGGQWGPDGSYLIVRQSDAHAWTEVWLEGEGWRRVDPTAAVSPARITAGVAEAVIDPASLPGLARGATGLFDRVRLAWDSIENRWNLWVVSYDGAQQEAFLERLGIGAVGGARYLLVALAVLLMVSLPVLWALRRARRIPLDPASRAYARFERRLSRLGVSRHPAEPAGTYAERAARALPQHADVIRRITGRYQQLRYGPAAGRTDLEEFQREVNRLRF